MSIHDLEQTRKMVQAMHDGLCRCGGWCHGAQADFEEFQSFVEQRWGYRYRVEQYLEELNG